MKSGLVAIVGKPNVGKSTLLNRLLGKKVSIVSSRPATTRLKILGILTGPRGQIAFLDTPGFEKPRHQLGNLMRQTILSALREADLVLLLVELGDWRQPEEELLKVLKDSGKKIILGINKIDLLTEKSRLLPIMDNVRKKCEFAEIVPFSALKDREFDALVNALLGHLPEAELLFPAGQASNLPETYLAAEIIREKLLQETYQEVPQETAVEVEEIGPARTRADMLVVKAAVIVERENLKSIIIGKQGSKIKAIGQQARQELEGQLGKKVYLDLRVKVMEKWRQRPELLRRFGYGSF